MPARWSKDSNAGILLRNLMVVTDGYNGYDVQVDQAD
jgi:hypothetical protein